ncbi:prostate androgen-regulated mucin-like protein 1 [Alligator mississippiensis]|uniref:Prostate androgen-regulated mucin-like protein 1 n=1 Tax=Alligator mississippiensis TaxID=8496 RepID=A0A151N5X1_ALLMI|nr:prostate androgen-regulated mucin-like protein 1 [Alligator mississippiensis]
MNRNQRETKCHSYELSCLLKGLSVVHSTTVKSVTSSSPFIPGKKTIELETTEIALLTTTAASITVPTAVPATPVATEITTNSKVTSGSTEQGNNNTVSTVTSEEPATATTYLSGTGSTDFATASQSPSANAGSESTATEHISTSTVTSIARDIQTSLPTDTTASELATHSTAVPATITPHLITTLSPSPSTGSSTASPITGSSKTQLPTTYTSPAGHTTEEVATHETPPVPTSSGPVTGQTSYQLTLTNKIATENNSTDSTSLSTGVAMEEVQHALSKGSIAAITVTVIAVVLLVFGAAAYLKIRHSSYGRLLDDHDYGSWGNYNNPLYDDS